MKKKYTFMHMFLFCVIGLSACGKSPQRIEDSELKFSIAKKFFYRGRVPEAIMNLEESLKENPKNSEAHNFYGLILFQSDRYEKSEKHFQKAVKINDKFADAHNNLCALYIKVNRLSKAETHCKKALSNLLYATPERAYYNLGRAYEQSDQQEQAIEVYEKAIKANPRFVLALDKLGNIQFKNKNYKQSEEYYLKATSACEASEKNEWGDVCGYSFLKLSEIYTIFKDDRKAYAALKSCMNYSVKNGQSYKACQTDMAN